MDYQEFYTEVHEHYYRANAYHTMRDPDYDATSGNHHLLNATYYAVVKRLAPEKLPESLGQFVTFVESTVTPDGWFSRHPTKMNQPQSHDDNIGIIVSSNLVEPIPGYAHEVYEYGQKRRYLLKNYYENVPDAKFRFGAWHSRLPGIQAIYKRGAGVKTNWLNKIGYCFYLLSDVYFNKDRSNTSGRIMQWLANSVMKGDSWIVDKCIDRWERNIKEVYSTGWVGEMLGVYHTNEHPFCKAMFRRM